METAHIPVLCLVIEYLDFLTYVNALSCNKTVHDNASQILYARKRTKYVHDKTNVLLKHIINVYSSDIVKNFNTNAVTLDNELAYILRKNDYILKSVLSMPLNMSDEDTLIVDTFRDLYIVHFKDGKKHFDLLNMSQSFFTSVAFKLYH